MNAQEVRHTLEMLGLTQLALARYLRIHHRTVMRWTQHGVTGTGDYILRWLASGSISLLDIERANREAERQHQQNKPRDRA